MSFASGKASVFKLDNGAGALTDISAYCNTGDLDQTLGTAETTTYGATGASKTYVPTLRDGKATIGGPFDPAIATHMNGLIAAQAAGTLPTSSAEYGPVSSVAGQPKYTFETIITDFKIGSPVGGVVTWSASLQVTGLVTLTTWP